jgi:LytS/YehU family sensor histidine kinase
MCYREPIRFDTKTANYGIPRSGIIQVRREYRRGIKMAAGVGIGAAAGAGIGAAADTKTSQTRAVGAVVGMLGGALIGLIVGSIVSHRGSVIYQQ